MGILKKHLHIKQVLTLYQKGVSQKSIAQKIGITEKTVGKWIKDDTKVKQDLEARVKTLEIELKAIKIKLSKYE